MSRRLTTMLLTALGAAGGVLAAADGAPAPSAPATTSAAGESGDPVIRFLEDRVAADTLDPTIAVRLGATYLHKTRETGDVTLYTKAEGAFHTAMARRADYVPALTGLGTTYLGQHRFREALAVAERAIAQQPDAHEAHALRGDACVELGDLESAEAAYAKFHALRPGLLSHARFANLALARGDAAAAIEQYETALRAGQRAANAPALLAWCLVKLGEVRFRTGDWDAAGRCYADAATFAPDDVAVLDHVAELRAARGEFDAAIAGYEQVVARSPRPEFFQALGEVYAAAGKPEAAEQWHDRALAGYLRTSALGNAGYYHHLVDFYCEIRPDGTEALAWATKDLELRRTTATLAALARAHHVAGNGADAAAAMDEALARPTADAHVLHDAGEIYARAGREGDARRCLDRAAKINPRFNAFHVHR